MNKNTLLGFLLIGAIMIGFGWYNSKQVKQQQQQQAQQDSITRANAPKHITPEVDPVAVQKIDSLQKEIEIQNLGTQLASALTGEEQFYTLENNLLAITFSNKGGRVYSVLVKNYQTYGKEPVVLFTGDQNKFALEFFTNQQVSTGNFYFQPVALPQTMVITENDTAARRLTMRLQVDSTAWIDYTYTMHYDSYMVDLAVNMVGMNKHIPQNANSIDLVWSADLKALEKGFENESNYSTIAYKYPNTTDIEELSSRKSDATEKINARVSWISFKQQFFSSVLIADNLFQQADVAYKNYKPDDPDKRLMHCSANMQLAYGNKAEEQIPFQFYFGPNHFRTLKSYGHSMEKMVPLGSMWIDTWINRLIIIPTFNFLGKFINSYGLIILLLTIFIKIILLPLTHKSHVSTAKMKVLKPEIDKINAKYPKQEDALKKQQETMALYKRTGVSVMGGCLPMLLQMPILFAMFRFFPASFELRQESFLWADDLSSYDSILNLPFTIPFYGNHVSGFGLLMAISMFFYSRVTMNQQPSSAQMPGMKFMQLYFMPIFMLFLFNNFSSGLNYYYMLSNFITIGQTWIIRKWFVDEDELLRKMKERAAQPQKKSKFQQRLEDMQKRQQQQAKQQQQQRKK